MTQFVGDRGLEPPLSKGALKAGREIKIYRSCM